MKIFLAVTIDTECDKGVNWIVKQPLSFSNVIKGIKKSLVPLFEKYNISPTYLLSPEVIDDDQSCEILQSFGGNVELGTHLHSEFIAPNSNFNSLTSKEMQCDLEASIERKKIINLTEKFISRFGYSPKSFRSGRFGISENTLKILEELKYEVDSSISPHKYWISKKNNLVNHIDSSLQPYFPSIDNYKKNGSMKILEFPVTIVDPFWLKCPIFIKKRFNPKNRYHHILKNIFFNSSPIWLRPTYSNPNQIKIMIDSLVNYINSDVIFLCMMFHSNEFYYNTSPYVKDTNDLNRLIIKLDEIFNLINKTYNVNSLKLSDIIDYV